MKRKIRTFLALVPALLLWTVLCVMLWGFVFARITDTTPDKKLTVCVDGQVKDAAGLAVLLEDRLAGNIRMVKVRPFDYAMFDSGALTNADIFLVPASHVREYGDWFAPLPEELRGQAPETEIGGVPRGVLVYDAASKEGAAEQYVDYADGQEDWFLLLGKRSVHVPGNDGAVDGAAVTAAEKILSIR